MVCGDVRPCSAMRSDSAALRPAPCSTAVRCRLRNPVSMADPSARVRRLGTQDAFLDCVNEVVQSSGKEAELSAELDAMSAEVEEFGVPPAETGVPLGLTRFPARSPHTTPECAALAPGSPLQRRCAA